MAAQLVDVRILASGQVYRKLPVEQLTLYIDEGSVTGDDLISPAGMESWRPIAEVPKLAKHLAIFAASLTILPDDENQATSGGQPPQQSFHRGSESETELSASVGWKAPSAHQQLEEPTVDMLPMIDVIFQLLIFFLLTSQFDVATAIEVPKVDNGIGVTAEGIQLILIDGEGNYYLGHVPKSENKMSSLAQLSEQVAENALNQEEPMDVIINAHRTAKHLQVRELVEQLNNLDVELGKIKIGVEEKK